MTTIKQIERMKLQLGDKIELTEKEYKGKTIKGYYAGWVDFTSSFVEEYILIAKSKRVAIEGKLEDKIGITIPVSPYHIQKIKILERRK